MKVTIVEFCCFIVAINGKHCFRYSMQNTLRKHNGSFALNNPINHDLMKLEQCVNKTGCCHTIIDYIDDMQNNVTGACGNLTAVSDTICGLLKMDNKTIPETQTVLFCDGDLCNVVETIMNLEYIEENTRMMQAVRSGLDIKANNTDNEMKIMALGNKYISL